MGYQPLENLLPRANYSIYQLVCMASKRAMELADGQPKLIDAPASMKTATLALEEIQAGKVMLRSVSIRMGLNKKGQRTEMTAQAEKDAELEQEQGV